MKGEIVIVPVPETRGRGLVKFRRKLSEILAEYKREEKMKEIEIGDVNIQRQGKTRTYRC
ncbi:hypothetical protein Ferp_1973 [Ferroglobus placidus DSM 10642]|uniref:Uncharacterized protein n=1 Tax=Ferroglobus placidus (strain DSM 10642 / AEDII12DO) TaxID=589924 RepID=D3S047_FERPA|nr:hypothetical protein [Ferroglobus placidus]ADC66110.1 hypothetical protein Ferp_1973 [Ferroglobus placidus DSM 10642]